MTAVIAVAGILVTALVAVFGYLYTNHAARRERIAETLAQALNTVGDYEDLPYRVRRRPSAEPATRAALAERISDIHSRIDFHSAWLRITAPTVAMSYELLVTAVRAEAGAHIKSAWLQPLITRDEEMNLGLGAQYQCPNTDNAKAECITVMRKYLRSPWYSHYRDSMPPQAAALGQR